MINLFGVIAVCSSLIMVLFGMPRQVMKNYHRKSCEGLDLFLFIAVLLAYLSWSTYGLIKPDYFLLVSQIPGAILSAIILVQFKIYGRR